MLQVPSPAKINLFLRILGKRSDGYHEFASLMQAIDLCDTLHVALDSEDCLTCTDHRLPTDSSNLILKAADLYRRKTGVKEGIRVHLVKRIPMEAGLGGGSGNAATLLWAFNELCGDIASVNDLTEWSAEIGSDIPFFFSSGTAFCTGRGEKVHSLPPLPTEQLWIVKPPEGLSTKAVYGGLNLSSLENRDPGMTLKAFFSHQPRYFNDLETPAFAIAPHLRELKESLLAQGYQTVLMSGSGSSFFCLGDQAPNVPSDYLVYRTKYLSRSSEGWYQEPSFKEEIGV